MQSLSPARYLHRTSDGEPNHKVKSDVLRATQGALPPSASPLMSRGRIRNPICETVQYGPIANSYKSFKTDDYRHYTIYSIARLTQDPKTIISLG